MDKIRKYSTEKNFTRNKGADGLWSIECVYLEYLEQKSHVMNNLEVPPLLG